MDRMDGMGWDGWDGMGYQKVTLIFFSYFLGIQNMYIRTYIETQKLSSRFLRV